MCGIFGIVTNKEQALGPILTEAALRLTYRGYDFGRRGDDQR